MAMTFVDDEFSYFDDVNTISSIKNKPRFSIGERVGKIVKNALNTSSPTRILELYRTRLIQLKELKNKLTLIRGVDVVNKTNEQISNVQKSLFTLENQFVSMYADKQGAKAVINSITENPDLTISQNQVAQNFLNQKTSPSLVTPVPTGVIYGGGIGYEAPSDAPEVKNEVQGSEVVDKTIEPKKDNTILYLGIGIIAVLLLTRK